jgi:glycosyltransferase involved in cell wall biosynthesis
VAVNVAQLAVGLGSRGWDVEVAGPPESVIHPALAAAGVAIHRLPFTRGFGDPVGDARTALALRQVVARGGFDLVHAHSSKAGLLARPVAATLRVPTVYTPHCYGFLMEGRGAEGAVAKVVERALGLITPATICVCAAERRAAVAAGIGARDRLHVVLNGCPGPDPEVPADPALTALAARGPVVAAVTVLRAQKRVDLLIDAAPAILARVPDAQIAVVGDGPLADAHAAHVRRLGLEGRVHLLPFTAPASRHLAAVDVLVLPSDWEALAIGLLEAMACGVPQVATDVGGTAEAVTEETGVLVPRGDARAVADAVIGLLEDPARRARLRAGSLRRHAEVFALDRMLDQVAGLYARVARGRGVLAGGPPDPAAGIDPDVRPEPGTVLTTGR